MSVALRQRPPDDLLEDALAPGKLKPSFQPIVDLQTNAVVGVEALARWPEVPGADPAAVFARAEQNARIVELDWACRVAAMRSALTHELDPRLSLLINVEAATLGQVPPPAYEQLVAQTQGRLRVVLELTERDLLRNPGELLKLVGWARNAGWGIAMDDVGAEPASLALLPLVAPDVVKLDLSLMRDRQPADQAHTLLAVAAYAEEVGAALIAEGIETEAHRERALSLNAQYGQGWLLGRPGPLTRPSNIGQLPEFRPFPIPDPTPFDLIRNSGKVRRGRKRLLLDMTHALERHAVSPGGAAVLMAAFQHVDNFTHGTADRYTTFARHLPLVAALGAGMTVEPAPGVRGINLDPADPLAGEWTVVVVGANYAGALIARDLGDGGPDLDRRFEFMLTHDRDLVLRAGRSLMDRIAS